MYIICHGTQCRCGDRDHWLSWDLAESVWDIFFWDQAVIDSCPAGAAIMPQEALRAGQACWVRLLTEVPSAEEGLAADPSWRSTWENYFIRNEVSSSSLRGAASRTWQKMAVGQGGVHWGSGLEIGNADWGAHWAASCHCHMSLGTYSLPGTCAPKGKLPTSLTGWVALSLTSRLPWDLREMPFSFWVRFLCQTKMWL